MIFLHLLTGSGIMKKMVARYWYVPIVLVVLLMLTLIMLITNQSAYQRITLWLPDPHVPNSLSDEKNQPPKSEAMQAVRENRTFHTIRKGGTIKEVSEVDDITLVGTSDGICGMEEYVSDIRLNMMQYNRERRKISIDDSLINYNSNHY